MQVSNYFVLADKNFEIADGAIKRFTDPPRFVTLNYLLINRRKTAPDSSEGCRG
jgi:hypothetical protein